MQPVPNTSTGGQAKRRRQMSGSWSRRKSLARQTERGNKKRRPMRTLTGASPLRGCKGVRQNEKPRTPSGMNGRSHAGLAVAIIPVEICSPPHARSEGSSVLRVFFLQNRKENRQQYRLNGVSNRVQRTARILTYRRAFQSFDETGSITPVAEQVYFVMLYADFILSIGTFDIAQRCRPAKRTK